MKALKPLAVGAVAAVALSTGGVAGASSSSAATPKIRGTQTIIDWQYNGSIVYSFGVPKHIADNGYTPYSWADFTSVYARTVGSNGSCAAIAGYYNGASNYSTNASGSC